MVGSKEGAGIVARLSVIYAFVAIFWALWDQSNGQTWTIQAQSDLMDKDLGFGVTLLPAQVQGANGIFILLLVPFFGFTVFPWLDGIVSVTPLRKIGAGLFCIALSFLWVAWIETKLMQGHRVSVWHQIAAYFVLTAAEVMVSPTVTEFSYQQAPVPLKSFVMALCLLATAAGNLVVAGVNIAMTHDLHATGVEIGQQTWIRVSDAQNLVTGQKIDVRAAEGITVGATEGASRPLRGTYIVAELDSALGRVRIADSATRAPVMTYGQLARGSLDVTTYRLAGAMYFEFFALMAACAGMLFIAVARGYRDKAHFRAE